MRGESAARAALSTLRAPPAGIVGRLPELLARSGERAELSSRYGLFAPVRQIVIAVDGPASSGKGTVARRVASRLGFQFVDTGAMYRTVALAGLRAGVDLGDAVAVAPIAQGIVFRFAFLGGELRVEADGEDVTEGIRDQQVGAAASVVATHAGVRTALLGLQRALGAGGGVVMDGRDIGTVVLPSAELKVYLDASLDERAERRWRQFPDCDFAQVRADLAERDRRDTTRPIAPLARAPDAVRIDTTGIGVESVVDRIVALATARQAR